MIITNVNIDDWLGPSPWFKCPLLSPSHHSKHTDYVLILIFILLLCCIPVVFMVTLYHRPIAVSLAAFDDFRLFRVNLKNKLFSTTVLHWSDFNIFQRNDAFWNVFSCVLEVVEAPIIDDKPTPLPSFPASALQHKKLMSTFVGNSSRSSVSSHTCFQIEKK